MVGTVSSSVPLPISSPLSSQLHIELDSQVHQTLLVPSSAHDVILLVIEHTVIHPLSLRAWCPVHRPFLNSTNKITDFPFILLCGSCAARALLPGSNLLRRISMLSSTPSVFIRFHSCLAFPFKCPASCISISSSVRPFQSAAPLREGSQSSNVISWSSPLNISIGGDFPSLVWQLFPLL